MREAVTEAILTGMAPGEIDEAFYGKPQQRKTIVCSVKEALHLQFGLSIELRNFLSDVLRLLDDEERRAGASFDYS